MIRSMLLLTLSICFRNIFANDPDNPNVSTLFLKYSTHRFASKQALKYRYNLFKTNLRHINKINAEDLGWKAGINKFTDLSDEELYQYKGVNVSARNHGNQHSSPVERLYTVSQPTSIDWRTAGHVTPVQDQGRCGSCWIFAAVAAIETRAFAAGAPKNGLSEQELVDCGSPYRDACQGGDSLKVFEYVFDNERLAKRADYPYKAKTETCKRTQNGLTGVKQRYYTYRYGADQMLTAISGGPIVIEFNAIPNFFKYKSGIFNDKSCSANIDHAMVAVGYAPDYVILKNSWGTGWGDKGFARVARGWNLCGMYKWGFHPNFLPAATTTEEEEEE